MRLWHRWTGATEASARGRDPIKPQFDRVGKGLIGSAMILIFMCSGLLTASREEMSISSNITARERTFMASQAMPMVQLWIFYRSGCSDARASNP